MFRLRKQRGRPAKESRQRTIIAQRHEAIELWTRDVASGTKTGWMYEWKSAREVWMLIVREHEELPEWVQIQHLYDPKEIHQVVERALWGCGLTARIRSTREQRTSDPFEAQVFVSRVEFRQPATLTERALLEESCDCGNEYLLGKGCYLSWAEDPLRQHIPKFCHELPLNADRHMADRIISAHQAVGREKEWFGERRSIPPIR